MNDKPMTRCSLVRCITLGATMVLSPLGPALASEFHILGGLMQGSKSSEGSYSWQLEYRDHLGKYGAYSISYLNEGHVPDHHRDGHAFQLWARTSLLAPRLSLAAGGGIYHYYDTTVARDPTSHRNAHGWGGIFSLSSSWKTEDRWLLQLRGNWVGTGESIDTLSALVGFGYLLDDPAKTEAEQIKHPHREQSKRNELTFFLGQTIVNSLPSEHSVATCLEYRRSLHPNVDLSLSWLNEGDNRLVRRHGMLTQLWAVKAFFRETLTLGIGGGAYLSLKRYDVLGSDRFLSGVVTLTTSYRLTPEWQVRASWNRIVTTYDRDTDVIMGGIGYRF